MLKIKIGGKVEEKVFLSYPLFASNHVRSPRELLKTQVS